MSDPESATRNPQSAIPPTPNPERRGPNPAPPRAVVALVVSIGLFSQVAQIVMFREMLATCRGTEVFFGVVLAAGLLWTALGSAVAGLFARRAAIRPGEGWAARAWGYAAALFSLNGLLLIGQIALARHRSTTWGGAAELTFLEAVASALLATGPVAFLCGVEFVLALHAARAEAFARLYQADAWGAVGGGLLFTFALVGVVDPVTLGPALTGALCLLVAAAGARRLMATGAVVGIAAAAAAWAGGLDARLHERRWRALYPGFKLVATQDSRYGQLAVLRHPSEEQHSLYLDGGLVETLPPPGSAMTDERNQAIFALAQHPAPRRVLLVGHSLGRLPLALLEGGIERLDALELDPAFFAVMRRALRQNGNRDDRLHMHFADARRFIKAQRGAAYDVILLNLPDPLSAFVNRLYTAEFFREAAAALSEGGVLVTSVTAAANYAGETVGQLSASILRTLQAVFPQVLVAPGERHTFIAATAPGLASLEPGVLARRAARRGFSAEGIKPEEMEAYAAALFENLIVTSQVESLRATLEGSEAAINTDARPITYQLALLVWNQVVSASTEARDPGMRGGTNALFCAALRFRFAHGLLLPAAILVPALALGAVARWRAGVRGAGRTYGVLVVAAATGLFGMAAEVILIYAFQSTYGYAYAEVGLLVAAFMVGLALGARVGGRLARRGFLLAVAMVMVGYCLALPAALGALGALGSAGRWVYGGFVALVLVAGFLDGATFPPLVQVLRGQGFERPGGWVYAADLAGSGVGALATGALLVPVLGASAALHLVAATVAAAVLAALFVWRS